jgi:hypothetical protein
MSRLTTRTPVAIFNFRAEFIDVLREALEHEGLPTATALLAEIQDGPLDLEIVFGEPYSIGEVVDAVHHGSRGWTAPRPERGRA